MFHAFPLFTNGWIYSKHLNSANKVVHSARCGTQDLYNTDAPDMNESQSWSLSSLNFLSADLTWLDMYIWLSVLNPCLHSGETWYDLNNWCFWLLNILNLLNKNNHKWLQMSLCLEQNSLRELKKKKRFRTTTGLSMDMWYEFAAGCNRSIFGRLRKVIATWLRC